MHDSPDIVAALSLGLLQGSTEFLPVSSSGHLAVFGMFYDVPEMSLALVLLLHAATLLATVAAFAGDLLGLARSTLQGLRTPGVFFRSPDGAFILNVVVASVPTAAIGLLMKDAVEDAARLPWVVGMSFLGSAAAAWSTRRSKGHATTLPLGAALLVGIAQGAAVLPGLSRSGSTIACAMALGMSPEAAFRFSFLLSLPVIAGATALELGDPDAWANLTPTAWLSALVTLVCGYVCLRMLKGLLLRGHFWRFALYLVPLGVGMLVFGMVGA